MSNIRPRFRAPKKVAAGEIVTLKTLISHPMESGQRKDKDGNKIPRNIINTFTCKLNGEVAFSADLDAAVSSPAYIEFSVKIDQASELELAWIDDSGETWTETAKIAIG